MLATSYAALALETVPTPSGRLAVRRISPFDRPLFVFEADLIGSDAAAARDHDALASCFWPAATSLASLLLDTDLTGNSVCDVGCGTGLCSLAAAASGASVVALDVEPTALALTSAAADAQGLGERVETREFDVLSDAPLPCTPDLLIASDCFVTPPLARALAARARAAHNAGATVLLIDPRRPTRDDFDRAWGAVDGEPCWRPLDAALGAELAACAAGATPRALFVDTEVGAPVDFCI